MSNFKYHNRRIETDDQERVRDSLGWLGYLTILCSVFALTWMAFTVMDPATLPIQKVKVEGDFRYLKKSTESIEQRVMSQVTGGFFTLDVERIQQSVLQEPWVYQASVRKLWPDTVQVKIVEQKASVQWGEKGFLNHKGELFKPEGEYLPRGLVVLNGPMGTEQQVFKKYQTILGLLSQKKRKITWLTMNKRRGWSFAIKEGPTIILGRKSVDDRLWRYVKQVERVLGKRISDIEQIDLRYTNGFAVREDIMIAADKVAIGT